MPFLLPYRAKNPPERYPYATISLIALNVFIFAVTSENFLVIRESIVESGAISHNTFSLLRMFTSMFLHGDLMHIAGNMLFLWIFGASAEGRLGPLKFIVVYLACGLAGDVAHELTFGLMKPEQFSLGASGAIMGLAGAYLYMFPFARICVFYAWSLGIAFRIGWTEWQAQWVILYFVGFDILNGLLFQGADGVGHLAHLGGFGMGFLTMLALRVRRDDEYVSEAQKSHAEIHGDYSLMAFHELAALMEQPNDNVPLIMTYIEKSLKQPGGATYSLTLDTLRKYSRLLIEHADPVVLGAIVLQIPESAGILPLPFYLSLGSRLEKAGQKDNAIRCYKIIYQANPAAIDAEMALFRWGSMLERSGDRAMAASIFTEMLQRFPAGALAMQGSDALRRLGGSSGLVFSAGNAAPRPAPASSGLSPVERTPFPAAAPAAGAAGPSLTAGDTTGMARLGDGPRPASIRPAVPQQPMPVQNDPGDDLRPLGRR